MSLACTSPWIISHFGRNPKNGGSPPKDSKLQNKANLSIGLEIGKQKI
jgi:hypothetical protein